MKKLSFIVAMALAAAVNFSCGEYDNTVSNGKTVIEDKDGNPHETELVAALQGTPGAEMEISFSTYEDDFCAISTGDYQSPATEVKANDNLKNSVKDKRTTFKFTVGDDGIVKVYGNSNIKTLYIGGGNEDVIVTFEQAKLADVQYIQIANAKVSTVKLPELNKLTCFWLNTCTGVANVDVSAAKNLDSLFIQKTVDSKLTSIDLSQNTELTTLRIGGKNEANNVLSVIDLRKNTKLKEINLAYNELSVVKLADSYENLESLSLTDNKLTEFSLDGNYPKLTSVFVNKNQLSSVEVPASVTTLNVANNKLKFTTIPLNATTYGNQAEVEVTLVANILDLSDQLNIEGNETVYTLNVTEGTDYEVIAPGKFKFLKKLTGVVVSMTNATFPKFTNQYPLKTVAFDTDEPSDEVYTWGYIGNSEYIEGGTIEAVPATIDVDPYTPKIGFWKDQYATVVVDGTKETLGKENANYIRVDLDETLKVGMKVSFTGFRYADEDNAKANLYLLFALPNYVDGASYPDYVPLEFDIPTGSKYTTFGWGVPHMFSNTKVTNVAPTTYTFIVDETLAGVKSFKIVREYAETPIYLTKIAILRK